MPIHFLSSAGDHSRGEGQGSDADIVTRSDGDADLHTSQPEMESGEMKVEMDMAVDPLYFSKPEQQPYSKWLMIDSLLQYSYFYVHVSSLNSDCVNSFMLQVYCGDILLF